MYMCVHNSQGTYMYMYTGVVGFKFYVRKLPYTHNHIHTLENETNCYLNM